jgi:hypothetical protein
MTAAGQGFEPRLVGPKPTVLPLDDPAILFVKGKSVILLKLLEILFIKCKEF